ncbi:MAG: virulence protein [Bacteroidota bacterium]|jgi:hypothetical protein|nr:virulence protein [Bacteroidota bacterium]OQC46064.1 MAG: hypothetical protein BWX59_00737 [Bacteroidetes bacterium ADurb.Bin028]HNY43395.1 DNA-binding protein [Bacteroidales bacterium]HOD88352.1 DNA-binding protein [Bacteroidales bacterium]
MSNEILLYQSNELTERIEVRLENETVWLSQQQMATLFQQTKQNISLHINNCFREKELDKNSTVKYSLTVQIERVENQNMVSSILEHTTQHSTTKVKMNKNSVQNIINAIAEDLKS